MFEETDNVTGWTGRIVAVAIFTCLLAGCAHVQPTQSWPELARRIAPGSRVAVTDAAGGEFRGKLSALSATSLALLVGDTTRRFEAGDVRQVRRNGDSLWNGLAIGAGIGVLANLLSDNKCSGTPLRCDDRQIPQRVALFGLMTGAGIGFDAAYRDRTVLYTSPARAAFRLVPVLGPACCSLAVAVRLHGAKPASPSPP